MATITIPKKLIKESDLVIIPRKEYEGFLRIAKKRIYTELDRDLDKAIAEVKHGKIIGPFDNAKDLMKNIRHASLRVKKYDEERGIWQARVDRNIRFYFCVESDGYRLLDIKKHPK
ncbi:hypothetical protein KGQ34_03265 [Patescibacteria group bacterium]|nr:hypothetical protein [Patescibacteria group bacterium]